MAWTRKWPCASWRNPCPLVNRPAGQLSGQHVVLSLPYFAATFAQESLRPTVRLKTGLPGCESLASTQK